MRLQTKVLVVAIALAVVVSGAMLALINYQLDQHVQSLEGTLAREAYVRARLLINARLAEVQRAAMRLATGAAARLLEQGDNTLPAAGKLAADDLHLLVVARIVKGGKLELLHVVAHTPQGGDVEPGALVAWQQPLDLLNFGRAPRSGLAIGPAGAIELASVPVIVARNGASDTRPAVSADDPGHVVAGSLLVGRLVQANGHSAWERALGQTVLLSPTQPPDEHAATATDDDPLLRIVEAETIAAGAPVQDIRAQPSLWLETRTRRSVFISGQASNAGAMVGLVFGGLVLTMSFIGVLRMLVLRRLSRLARAAAQVRHAGDLVRRIDDDSTDEVGQLVRAFNTMLDRLDEQAEQARGTNRELVTALQARDELLHTLSHELRTPLATIRGFAERLQSMTGSGPAATGGPAPKEIERAVDHLLGLINDLLDLARARAGRLEVTLGPVDIMDALDDVMAMLRVQAEARGLTLEAHTDDALPPAHADHRRLCQVLINLIGNAIKFCDRGVVRVTATAGDATHVEIRVQDDGPGFPPERAADLFQPFVRLATAGGPRPGTGLGLAIAHELVTRMGGTLSATSAPGEGATFVVSLKRIT